MIITLELTCAGCHAKRVIEVREGPREFDEDPVPDVMSLKSQLAAIGWTLPGPRCRNCR